MSQDFKNQREIFQWLLDGGKVRYADGDIVFLKDGKLNDIWTFGNPEDWSKYIPEKPKVKWAQFRSLDITKYGHVRAFPLTDKINPAVWRLIPGSEFEDEE